MEGMGDLTDDEDFVELVEIMLNRRKQQNYRERPNHFTKWNCREFQDRFRLSKNVVQFITDKIVHALLPNTNRNHERNHTLSPAEMVLVTLRFLATGCFLKVAGDFSGIDKATASRVISKVTIAIATLKNEYINMPQTEVEMADIRQGFFNIAKFPRCIGALDCTHVKIQSPGGPNAELFRNRKGFFSVNVQVVCSAALQPLHIVCRWPGSAHDSTIFLNSTLRARLENEEFGQDSLIVGDSGYAIKRYLITPLGNTTTAAENLFNESQIRTRNPIERFFGIWKRRFPILAYGIRLDFEKVEAVVIATAVLQSIAQRLNDPAPPVNVEIEGAVEFANDVNINDRRNNNYNDVINVNNSTRFGLIHEYFQNML